MKRGQQSREPWMPSGGCEGYVCQFAACVTFLFMATSTPSVHLSPGLLSEATVYMSAIPRANAVAFGRAVYNGRSPQRRCLADTQNDWPRTCSTHGSMNSVFLARFPARPRWPAPIAECCSPLPSTTRWEARTTPAASATLSSGSTGESKGDTGPPSDWIRQRNFASRATQLRSFLRT